MHRVFLIPIILFMVRGEGGVTGEGKLGESFIHVWGAVSPPPTVKGHF